MVTAALHTDELEIWWVYLLEGIAAIVFGLSLPMGFLLLSFSVMAALALGALLLIEGAALISWACHLRESCLAPPSQFPAVIAGVGFSRSPN